jgi:hypothetical protein
MRPQIKGMKQAETKRAARGAAGLRLAVLLALDHAAVAGQEAALLQGAAQARLVIGEGLRDAMADGAGLARQAAALNGGDDVVLAVAVGGDDRLLQHHLQDGTREIGVEVLVVDGDAARARLDPDARDRVLALAGGIGAAALVQLLHMDGRGRRLRLGRGAEFGE